ncbi:cytochrome C oxidase subunit IV family protein [Rickettsiales bacterium LUAb2]
MSKQCCSKFGMKSLVFSFFVSVILAVIAFALVSKNLMGKEALYNVVIVLLLLQVIMQCKFFVKLSAKNSDYGWVMISFIFTVVILALVITGNLWIIHNLHHNMM